MGWDLHAYVEQSVDGKWVFQPQPVGTAKNYQPYPGEAVWRERNLEADYWDGRLLTLPNTAWNESVGPAFCAKLGLVPSGLPHDCSSEVYARYAVWVDSVLETYAHTLQELQAVGIRPELELIPMLLSNFSTTAVRVIFWCCATEEPDAFAREIPCVAVAGSATQFDARDVLQRAGALVCSLRAAGPDALRTDSTSLQLLCDTLLEAQYLLWHALRHDKAA